MPGHGAGHPRPGEPGADHQIRLAGTERSQQPRHLGRPVAVVAVEEDDDVGSGEDRKSTRLNSSHGYISYAVFCLKKKKKHNLTHFICIISNRSYISVIVIITLRVSICVKCFYNTFFVVLHALLTINVTMCYIHS